jgi:hypothetical protein
MWALWVMGGLVVWFVVAALVGVVIGSVVRLADRRASRGAVLTTADLPSSFAAPLTRGRI